MGCGLGVKCPGCRPCRGREGKNLIGCFSEHESADLFRNSMTQQRGELLSQTCCVPDTLYLTVPSPGHQAKSTPTVLSTVTGTGTFFLQAYSRS